MPIACYHFASHLAGVFFVFSDLPVDLYHQNRDLQNRNLGLIHIRGCSLIFCSYLEIQKPFDSFVKHCLPCMVGQS